MHAELNEPFTYLAWKDWQFFQNANWELKFVWWPVRCDKSNKLLWLKYAYRGSNSPKIIVDAGMSKVIYNEIRWLRKQEFIFGKIAGTI